MDQLIFDKRIRLNDLMFYWEINNKYRIYCAIKEFGYSICFDKTNYDKSDEIDFFIYEADSKSDWVDMYADTFNKLSKETLEKFGLSDSVNKKASKKEFERVFDLIYNSAVKEGVNIPSLNKEVKKQEKPCRSCCRMNDIGVSSCWWCEIKSPTG